MVYQQAGCKRFNGGVESAGRPDVMEEARETVDRLLSTHQPLPLDEEIDRELERIRKRAEASLS